MSTFRQIFYQVVFGTKNREASISTDNEDELYNYIRGIVNNRKCKLYRVNGMPDHIHIFLELHPAICLSELVKDIKVASSIWMKDSGKFRLFSGWQDGYGAFTYSIREKDMIIDYIKNQKEHHKKETFYEDYKRLLIENGVDFDERYLL